jgi:hypothetical protein
MRPVGDPSGFAPVSDRQRARRCPIRSPPTTSSSSPTSPPAPARPTPGYGTAPGTNTSASSRQHRQPRPRLPRRQRPRPHLLPQEPREPARPPRRRPRPRRRAGPPDPKNPPRASGYPAATRPNASRCGSSPPTSTPAILDNACPSTTGRWSTSSPGPAAAGARPSRSRSATCPAQRADPARAQVVTRQRPPSSAPPRRSVEPHRACRPRSTTSCAPRAPARTRTDLVFTAPRGGPVLHRTFWSRVWLPAVEHLDPGRASTTCATRTPRRCSRAGADPHRAARLGHESITTTVDTYGNLLPRTRSEVLPELPGHCLTRLP